MNTKNKLRIGMIGLDTSHVTAFTSLLNDESHPYHVAGGTVIAAYPGGSDDFELSYSRVQNFTRELQEKYGVLVMDSLEETAEQCDAVMLESIDGRVHLEQFQRVAHLGKPVFIDKPFAISSADAKAMITLAEEQRVPLMSSSALRFAEGIKQVLAEADGPILGADCYGPMELQPTQPGLFWYGIHSVEMLYALMGPGCVKVSAVTTEDYDLVTGVWADGRIGTIRGNRKGNYHFGATVHLEKSTRYVDISTSEKPYYASLLEQIVPFFQTGLTPIPLNETWEIIRFIEAANESRITGESVDIHVTAEKEKVLG